jgi:8-oxo-dGTP pyrophosphatase MutT (NUDIX family)
MNQAGLVLEVQKTSKWIRESDGQVRIGLGGIGGKIEDGETPVTALQRESLEEIGAAVHIASAPFTIAVDPDGVAHECDWTDEPRPILVWESGDPNRHKGVQVVVFLGHLLSVPRPGDLPAVVTMSLAAMSTLASVGPTIEDLIQAGALLKEREQIPRDAKVIPVGTISVLCNLGENYPDLFSRIQSEAEILQSIGLE